MCSEEFVTPGDNRSNRTRSVIYKDHFAASVMSELGDMRPGIKRLQSSQEGICCNSPEGDGGSVPGRVVEGVGRLGNRLD